MYIQADGYIMVETAVGAKLAGRKLHTIKDGTYLGYDDALNFPSFTTRLAYSHSPKMYVYILQNPNYTVHTYLIHNSEW